MTDERLQRSGGVAALLIEVCPRVSGPLGPYAQGFCKELARRGYSGLTAQAQVHLMAHLSHWLISRIGPWRAERGAARAGLWPVGVPAARSGCRRGVWVRWWAICADWVWVPEPPAVVAEGFVEELLPEFGTYLRRPVRRGGPCSALSSPAYVRSKPATAAVARVPRGSGQRDPTRQGRVPRGRARGRRADARRDRPTRPGARLPPAFPRGRRAPRSARRLAAQRWTPTTCSTATTGTRVLTGSAAPPAVRGGPLARRTASAEWRGRRCRSRAS